MKLKKSWIAIVIVTIVLLVILTLCKAPKEWKGFVVCFALVFGALLQLEV